jgi:hypothetical protein
MSSKKSFIGQKKSVWITIDDDAEDFEQNYPRNNAKSLCDESCLIDGLIYAQVLGDAAKNGIDVLFFKRTSQSSNAFKDAINKLHNDLIGTKVFNTRTRMASSLDPQKQPSVYAYCSKKMNGGVTMMGINYANTRAKINAKLSASIESNSIVSHYLLSVADGVVLLNNEKFNGTISPAYKFKKIANRKIDFTIPPLSIAFWVIKDANCKECIDNLKAKNKVRVRSAASKTSADNLLKILASDALNVRVKRQLPPFHSFQFPNFDLSIPNLMPSNVNQRSIKDVLFDKNTEIFKVAPIETNPLQSSENPALPNGDVYLLVNDGMNDDYVQHDEVIVEEPVRSTKKNKKATKKSSQRDMMTQPTEALEYSIAHDYIESSHRDATTTKKSTSKKSQKPQPIEVGELFESELPAVNSNVHFDQMKDSNRNVEIKTVVKELEPTQRQSKKALMAAKQKWNRAQLSELLKEVKLEEVDKSKLEDADNFKIIEYVRGEDNDYNDYDSDEDGFFSSDDDSSNHKIRTKRNAEVDYRKNEIRRYGGHYVDEDTSHQDDESSIETIVDDVHLFLQPRNEYSNVATVATTTTTTSSQSTEEKPLGVRIIDSFTKSLGDVVITIHKNMIGWYMTFNDPKYS